MTTRPTKFTNESDVKRYVRSVFAEMQERYPGQLWFFMPPANGYGRAGIPDFVGTFNGRSFAVETKFKSGQLTPHQVNELAALTQAKARTWIVRETSTTTFSDEFCGWCALCS